MNTYIAFYNDKSIEIRAESLYRAKLEAIKQFKVNAKNEWKVSVMLAALEDGKEIIHVAVD